MAKSLESMFDEITSSLAAQQAAGATSRAAEPATLGGADSSGIGAGSNSRDRTLATLGGASVGRGDRTLPPPDASPSRRGARAGILRGTPPASPGAGSVRAAPAPSAPRTPTRTHSSHSSLEGVQLTFNANQKLKDLTMVMSQQQATVAALQGRLEAGLAEIAQDVKTSMADCASLARLVGVEEEMAAWVARRNSGEAAERKRSEELSSRCDKALAAVAQLSSQGAQADRRLERLEQQVSALAEAQADQKAALHTQCVACASHSHDCAARFATMQDSHAQAVGSAEEWQRRHATTLTEHEQALGDLRAFRRASEAAAAEALARIGRVSNTCTEVEQETDRNRRSVDRVVQGLTGEVTKLRHQVELERARSNAAAALAVAVTRLTAELSTGVREARSCAEDYRSITTAFAEGHSAAPSAGAAGLLLSDGASRFASKGMSAHSELLAQEARDDAAKMTHAAATVAEAGASGARATETLALTLEVGAAQAAGPVSDAAAELEKQEALVQLRDGLHTSMVATVAEQTELTVASAVTAFEEEQVAPKLTVMSEKISQGLGECTAAVEKSELVLRQEISSVSLNALLSTFALCTEPFPAPIGNPAA